MTVKELIDALSKYDDDIEIVDYSYCEIQSIEEDTKERLGLDYPVLKLMQEDTIMILLKVLLGIILLCIAILSIAGAAFCCVFSVF